MKQVYVIDSDEEVFLEIQEKLLFAKGRTWCTGAYEPKAFKDLSGYPDTPYWLYDDGKKIWIRKKGREVENHHEYKIISKCNVPANLFEM